MTKVNFVGTLLEAVLLFEHEDKKKPRKICEQPVNIMGYARKASERLNIQRLWQINFAED
ncbi:MAG: hypothetical protein SFU99_04225 [Saprospiraceae bacterium]|nr:hypothetical protein [Saprospiraceae bacterium]